MAFGEKLYQLRKRDGISQDALAEAINVSRQAISRWEQDAVIPDTANLVKVCNYFNVSLEHFMSDDCDSIATTETDVTVAGTLSLNAYISLLITGLVLIFASIVIAYPIQKIEFKVNGSAFTNPLNYLCEFPLNIVLTVGIILSIVSFYMIIKRGRKK